MVPTITDNYLYPLQEHTFDDLVRQITPGTPFLAAILILLGYAVLGFCARTCCCRKEGGDVSNWVVIEGLNPFYSALKSGDREFWFREEVVAQERIGMKRISKRNFEALVIAPAADGKNRLRDVHNYDILTNPLYSDRFLYIPCSYPDRHQFTVSEYKDNFMKCYSTDLVRLAVDLAYMPVSQAKALEFSEKFIFTQMLH